MAEVIFRAVANDQRLGDRVLVDSAGTGDWHVGEAADARTLAALSAAGFDGSSHRAKQFDVSQFASSDLIVYFDHSHERVLESLAPDEASRYKLQSMVSFDPLGADLEEVPDPYYAGDEAFQNVLELIDRCCRGLFRQVAPALQSS